MADYSLPSVSVVIPVYGDGGCLLELVSRADKSFADAGLASPQFVLVDDNGPGASWDVISQLVSNRPNTRGIQLMRNFGQHNALMCGFRHCDGDVIVTMDDDLQHPPESIQTLVTHLKNSHADLVYGCYEEKQHASGRNLGSLVVNTFFRLVFWLPVTITSFRAIRRELITAILSYDLNYTFVDGLLAWNTRRISEVPVQHFARREGRSGYSIGKLVLLAMNMFTNFSLLPLQCVSIIGFLVATGGTLLGAWYLFAALRSEIQVPGYASTIVAVLVLGGLQMLSLGIIGEYLGRLHLNVNRKPQYTVRHFVDHGHSTSS